MTEYRRPTFPVETYRDEQGGVIDYGNRWARDSPPDDAYSRMSNLQRFAPLHDVATALIEWLQSAFDVTVEETPTAATDFLLKPDDVVRAIRVVPRDPTAAPLTFVLTRFPAVYLHAGLLHDFHFPDCGCDACDDDLTGLAEELEWTVRTVVSGGYSERFDPWPGRWIEFRLDEPGAGMRSGRSRTKELPDERVTLARTSLPPAGQWLPWQELPQGNSDAIH
ncbi:DUF6226 family protein [Leifsonia sp. Root112D2]|uniref:DUF6226 family protein n=1 Tax=Leifsonia sp. Root112D2 TaxID=1736426 RepID=UPI0006F6D8E7|nr:DUF6226 family protein [Leifsonia sp. Root112D2]KQV06956.1 hypothetical protein ASC63_06280 [Leifsonia sp. Root112D2]